MFESRSKKELRTKYNKLGSVMTGGKQFGKGSAIPSNTVYGELKLSELLSNELSKVREHVDQLMEDLEDSNYQKETLKQEL